MAASDRLIEVVSLREDRGGDVTALIARAFQDDPLFAYACPDPRDRARWLPWFFRWGTWLGFRFGQTLGTVGRLDGVAVTIGPDGGEFTEEQLTQLGFGPGRQAVGPAVWTRAMERLSAAFGPADAALHRAVPEPHWYLDMIAVEPAQQGRGIGGQLLRAVHARADADETPVILLTFQPQNLDLYRHAGYAVVCQGEAPGSGLPWWGLRRDPDSLGDLVAPASEPGVKAGGDAAERSPSAAGEMRGIVCRIPHISICPETWWGR